ncbi:MAG: hypothetical protein PHG85_04825 [Candidatus Altiarchaeota archaeon]|nr:hypothetical protein [Candidatus Altiarchaeota archaeon]
MKILIHVIFNPGEANEETTNMVLAELGITEYEHESVVTGMYSLVLEKGDERIQKLIDELNSFENSPILREERIYTKIETDSAELLVLYIKALCGDGYNVYGTEFDKSSVCPVCGSGEVQKSDLIINKFEMGNKDIAVAYSFEIVISEKLAKILSENNLTGLELRPVRHYTTRMKNEPNLFQIIPTCTLPPLASPPSRLVKAKEYCKTCGKSGLFIDPPFYYQKEDLSKVKVCDFDKTTEFFGIKLTRGIPRQAVIISQKVYQILKKNKIRNIRGEPVHLI